MKNLIILTIAYFLVSSVQAQKVDLEFTETHFLNGYKETVYIKDGIFVKILDQKTIDIERNRFNPVVPEIETKQLTHLELTELANKMDEFGILSWKEKYPDEVMICDGFGFYMYVELDKEKNESKGSCYSPKNYDQVKSYLFNIGKSPNKPLNSDAASGAR